MALEGRHSNLYFQQLFMLFAKEIRTSTSRHTYRACDFLNNCLNYSYSLLRWKVYAALSRAKLEPHLGFLHTEQHGKPSLMCDIMELYRCNVDNFLVEYSESLSTRDRKYQFERFTGAKVAVRECIQDASLREIQGAFYKYLERRVDMPRTRVGNVQTFETLISEECSLLARYLRGQKSRWVPRIVV